MRCQHCHRELSADEPVYRPVTLRSSSLHWSWGGIIGALCAECAGLRVEYPKSDGTLLDVALFGDQEWRAAEACYGCGRPVVLSGRRPPPRYVVCGQECRRKASDKAAADLRRRRREARAVERRCAACGGLFVPGRSDAAHCSRACWLRAYRQRRAEGADDAAADPS
jgi:hypothetical protein